MKFNKLRLPLLVVVLSLVLFSCGKDSQQDSSATTLETIKKDKVIRIGYANEAPYAYQDESGRITGEAPEIARVVLKDLGDIKIEGVLTEFGSLIPGLKAKRFDIIAAGMYITPERCQQIRFSNPTYGIGEAFAVLKGNPKKLHSYEDVAKHSDATLGVVAGSVERGYAKRMGIPNDRVMVFSDAPSAIAGVAAKRVDAYAGTALTVQDLVRKDQSGKIERANPFTDPSIDGKTLKGYGAFGFRQDDVALREAFDGILEKFIGSEAHLKLVKPFGFTQQEVPVDVTAASLCGTTP